MSKVVKASKYSCARCETEGRKRKAEVFVGLNDIDAEYETPLCRSCADQWRIELYLLLNNDLEE